MGVGELGLSYHCLGILVSKTCVCNGTCSFCLRDLRAMGRLGGMGCNGGGKGEDGCMCALPYFDITNQGDMQLNLQIRGIIYPRDEHRT